MSSSSIAARDGHEKGWIELLGKLEQLVA
jgi:hypothetical protein